MNAYLSKAIFWLTVLLATAAFPASAQVSEARPPVLAAEISAEGAYVYIPMPGKTTTAAFFTLHNHSTKELALVAVQTDVAGRVELHSHSHKDGMMQMRREEKVAIPPKTSLAFQSGSWHVMLFDLRRTLQTGEQLHLTLLFSDGTSLPVTAQVKSRFDQPHH